MNRTVIARGLVTTVAAIALGGTTPAAAAVGAAAAQAPVEVPASPEVPPTSPTAYLFAETLAKLSGEQLETTFLAEIIPHHRAAIEMAQLELERGASPDIRTHADNIVANQQHQIDQFTRWLDEWYGLTPEAAMAQAPEEARQEMALLEQETQQMVDELAGVPAGEEFDVAFVRMMVPHHQAGIVEFLEPQARAVHAELRVAATSGITTQEMQVADFLTWLSGRA
ncbi:DUF305 domain-containing protein [Geodermatophilus sp. SYSU D00708]